MNTRPMPSDDADDRLQQAALYYAGALTAVEAAQFETVLASADSAFRAACRELEAVATQLVESVPAVSPPPSMRETLLERTAAAPRAGATPRIVADNPELERHGIFICRQNDADWQDHQIPGIRFRNLYIDHTQRVRTMLMRCAPGTRIPEHLHHGPEECLILEGELRIGDEVLRPGDFQRSEPGSQHMLQWTPTGCLVLLRSSLD